MKIRPLEKAALDPTTRRKYVSSLKSAYDKGRLEMEMDERTLPRRLLEALFPETTWTLSLPNEARWSPRTTG